MRVLEVSEFDSHCVVSDESVASNNRSSMEGHKTGLSRSSMDEWNMNDSKLPRLTLATLPTPLHRLQNLSDELATEVWIKRDDLTGFAMGGNKVRKAEFIFADVLAQKSDVVLTIGATQSNHACVVAAAARRLRIECHLFLAGQMSEQPTGNLLLDRLAGAELHFVNSFDERSPAMEAFAEVLRAKGRIPYTIPLGGSNAIGAYGYVVGFQELENQLRSLPPRPTRLVFASSSCGTYAGLLAGKALLDSEIELLGVRVDLDPNPEETICAVADACAQRIGLTKRFRSEEVHLKPDYAGEDYGVPTEEGSEALTKLWQSEGTLLDPVYTAKAMAGLIDLARRGEFINERVVFLHTGGAPAVFTSIPRLEFHTQPEATELH